jgi:hypothetical protein
MNTIENETEYKINGKEFHNQKRQEILISLKQFLLFLENLELPFTITSHERINELSLELRVMTENTEYKSLQTGLDECYDNYRFLNSCTAKECIQELTFRTNQIIQIIERR